MDDGSFGPQCYHVLWKMALWSDHSRSNIPPPNSRLVIIHQFQDCCSNSWQIRLYTCQQRHELNLSATKTATKDIQKSAVRHSLVTPIICSCQTNVSSSQIADHAAHLCRDFDWGPIARRIFFLGPWEKKNIHQNCIQLDKLVQTAGSEKRTNNNNSVRLFQKLLKIYLFRVRLKPINWSIQSCNQNTQENKAD